MNPQTLITVDGPAASGKGTIAQKIAQALGWHYLDSGALYRIVTQQAMSRGMDLTDEAALVALMSTLQPRFDGEAIYVDGVDISQAIREQAVSQATSQVAALPQVRQALFEVQRRFWTEPGLVADGRDMGTVVFPEAKVKFFITADVKVRAERRYRQALMQGQTVELESIEKALRERDARDQSRTSAPLKPAEDAVMLDTTHMDVDTVMKKVLEIIRNRL